MNHRLTLAGLLIGLALPSVARAQETAGPLSTSLTAGYDSRYVLYGYRLSRHLWHADVYFYYPLSDRLSLNGGSWYGYLTDGTYREVDLYGGFEYAVTEQVSAGFQYSLFNYLEVPFETSDEVHELAVHGTYASGPFSLQLRDQYDSEADGHLVRALAGVDHNLAGKLGISLNAEVGYALAYFIEGNRWNHALFTARFPYAVSDSLALTPFIARSVPLAALEAFEENETYGGGSITLFF